MIFCTDCDESGAICDFCKYYAFNADKEGRYVGKGYCHFHKAPRDPIDGCEDFHCFRAFISQIKDKIDLLKEANDSHSKC